MTPRENLLEVIRWGNPEYIPLSDECWADVSLFVMNMLGGSPFQSGKDPFGVDWIATNEGSIPDNRHGFLMEDISEWRDVVKFPDLDAIAPQVHAIAQQELANADRENKVVRAWNDVGLFERLAAFMGFEGALISMAEDPEECSAFFSAMADYKVKVVELLIDAYQPDVFMYFDDIAAAGSMFMSPATWKELIKPHHARIVKAATDRGVIFQQHVCGKCEAILDDYVEMGVSMWHSAQIVNDLVGIQKRLHGKLVIEGGWDSSGIPGRLTATEDDIRAEVRRCCETYGPGGGFILFPVIINERGHAARVGDPRLPALFDEWEKCKAL